jgi:hypothetical protein
VLRDRIAVIASIVATSIIISSLFMLPQGKNILRIPDANSSDEGKLAMVSLSDNSHVEQSKHVISPDPFGNFANYTIQDGEEASSQHQTGNTPKIVDIMNQNRNGVTSFRSVGMEVGAEELQQPQQLQNQTALIRDLTYYVKFECGTISGNEGPLRPGHYDTDIGILNKQDFATQIQWSITANNSKNTNSIIQTLERQGSTNIVCKDLRNIIGNDQNFVEGFVIINVPLEPGLLGSLSHGTQILGQNFEDMNNFIEVQAFYTANALDELPHPILVDKIILTIVNDSSGKIPMELINKTLDITVPGSLNQISDPESKAKDVLAAKYGLSTQERTNLQILIESINGSVGAMIDDHAISLSTVMPQASEYQ